MFGLGAVALSFSAFAAAQEDRVLLRQQWPWLSEVRVEYSVSGAAARACLEYIAESEPSQSFLDVGCGSGILAVAARLLGFGNVSGFDLDADAVQVANETAAANGVEIPFFRGDLSGHLQGNPEIPSADFVAANVLGPVLIRFADRIATLVNKGGTIILSGILEELYPEVKAKYESLGFTERSSKLIGEWRTGLFVN